MDHCPDPDEVLPRQLRLPVTASGSAALRSIMADTNPSMAGKHQALGLFSRARRDHRFVHKPDNLAVTLDDAHVYAEAATSSNPCQEEEP
jgi:hypothetical protein